MAGRKTRAAAAKAHTSDTPTPSLHTVDNPLDAENQTPDLEREEEPEEINEDEGELSEEDMTKPKAKKGKKGGKKKAGKKTRPAPSALGITSEAVEKTTAVPDEEFNPAAMPVLRSPKKDVEADTEGEYLAVLHNGMPPSNNAAAKLVETSHCKLQKLYRYQY